MRGVSSPLGAPAQVALRGALPVLLDLPRELALSWHAEDPEAGIPARVVAWRWEAGTLRLRLGA